LGYIRLPRLILQCASGHRGGGLGTVSWVEASICLTCKSADGGARRAILSDPGSGRQGGEGFRDKRLHWSVCLRIKEWTGDRDLGHRLLQDRRGLCWPEFNDYDGFGVAPTAERHMARGAGIAYSGHLAVGDDKLAIRAFFHQGHWRRIWFAAASTVHRQHIGVTRCEPHTEQDAHQAIEQAAPAA
jgi:hypothetical protein